MLRPCGASECCLLTSSKYSLSLVVCITHVYYLLRDNKATLSRWDSAFGVRYVVARFLFSEMQLVHWFTSVGVNNSLELGQETHCNAIKDRHTESKHNLANPQKWHPFTTQLISPNIFCSTGICLSALTSGPH